MPTVLPPREVFETVIDPSVDGMNDFKSLGGFGRSNYVKTVCPPDGGMYMYFTDEPYPYSTHPYINAVKVNAIVKRQTMALIMPFTKPWKFFETYLFYYCQMADSIYRSIPAENDGRIRIPYLKEKYYDPLCLELWRFLYHFLMNYGITEDVSYRFGKIVATMLQYDNAYREPIKDIFSETTKEKLANRKEIKRLSNLLSKRAVHIENEVVVDKDTIEVNSMIDKFVSIGKLLSWLLIIPKIKKAYRKALTQIDIKKLQQSEADYYHSLHRSDYNYGGRTWEVREAEYQKIRSHLIIK